MKNKQINHNHSHDPFDNPEKFLEKFDGVERDEWQKPNEVIKSFNLPDDAVVVEIGSGTGYFAVRLAKEIPNAKIMAFDQSIKMTEYLTNRVQKLGLKNIAAYTVEPEGSIALKEKVDLIFLVDVYHHMSDRISYFSDLTQHLKPKGKIVIIDRTEEKVLGQLTGHRVSSKKVKEEMDKAGLEFEQELDFLLPVLYYLSFKLKS